MRERHTRPSCLSPSGFVLPNIGDAVRGDLANEVFGEGLVVAALNRALPSLVLRKLSGKALNGSRPRPETNVHLVRGKAEQNCALPEHRDTPLDCLRSVRSDTFQESIQLAQMRSRLRRSGFDVIVYRGRTLLRHARSSLEIDAAYAPNLRWRKTKSGSGIPNLESYFCTRGLSCHGTGFFFFRLTVIQSR